jgi:hypothetical protein
VSGAGLSPSGGPLLVELLGAPGAGKSTVFEGLIGREERIRPRPILRRGPDGLLLARNVVAVLAMLARRRALDRTWTWEQLVMMAYLQAVPRVLSRQTGIVVFDQGPIYCLTRPRLLDERLHPWWQRTFDTWRSLLDAVVWLEAPDAVLLDRINERSKLHRLKGSDDEAAFEALKEARRAHQDAIARLDGRDGAPAILRFDTSRRSAEEIVDEVLEQLAADHRTSPRVAR